MIVVNYLTLLTNLLTCPPQNHILMPSLEIRSLIHATILQFSQISYEIISYFTNYMHFRTRTDIVLLN